MKIAIAQMHIYAGNPARNLQTLLDWISQAQAAGAELIVFPELCFSGLLVGDSLEQRGFLEECLAAGQAVATAATGIQVLFGNYVRWQDGSLGNGVYLAANGALRLLNVPLGDSPIAGAYDGFVWDWSGEPVRLELATGELRVALLLGDWQPQSLPPHGEQADLLIDLTCRPLNLSTPPTPAAYGRPCLRVNAFGLQNSGKTNYLFPGGSCWLDGDGRLLATADWFREGLYFWSEEERTAVSTPTPDKLLTEGLVSGVRCFCEQAGIERAVIGMSGGIDSALAGCVYRQALGPENVFVVSMPTRFNSNATKSLAQGMAQGLGLPFSVLPIESSTLALQEAIEAASFRFSDGQERRLTLSGSAMENVMARERCHILAALAAGCGGIFTCNGNKAELTVGYATFYGDLAGAFAAQADLWKYQVYQACAAFQLQFPDAPLAQIAAIRPSAELSEAQAVDKGLGDPLIYSYHDYLLRSWVEDNQEPLDSLVAYASGTLEAAIGCETGLVQRLFPDLPAFCADLEYWWKCYRGLAIAKRIQAPPLLSLSAHPFGEAKGQVQASPYFSASYQAEKGRLLS